LRQQVRGWRLIVLGLLFLIPGALATMVSLTMPHRRTLEAQELAMAFIYVLMAHALAPLAALLCAAGVVRDDVEDQTLTYLLLRPVPRWALYAIKLLASMIITILLTAFFSVATLALIARLTGDSGNVPLTAQAIRVAAIFSVTQVAYCGLFGVLGLLMRRSLLVGVAYIIIFEGLLASFNTLARKLTVMYYFRVLVLRGLNPSQGKSWEIDLATAPSAAHCALTLLIAGLVFAVIGAIIFASREFRMKTPEGE
jgi:ABC-2 type transport system permease protein